MAKALDPKVKAQREIARRNEKIVKMRTDKGMSLKAIAEKVGLTGPRVYKIVAAAKRIACDVCHLPILDTGKCAARH
jgi:DNA-directed RNA polymerase specialized sigma subunit